jgi:AcrR family transcriptional regulator
MSSSRQESIFAGFVVTLRHTVSDGKDQLMPPEKIDRRKQRTRQLLRESLQVLILEQGYDAITIQEITDHANLGRATFYLHYRDKDELLVDALETMFDQLVQQIDRLSPQHILELEAPPSLIAFRHVQVHHDLYRVMLSERGIAFVIKRVRRYLAGFA